MKFDVVSLVSFLGAIAGRINDLAPKAGLKSSDQRAFQQIAKDLTTKADELQAGAGEGADADGNPLSPLTGGTGAPLEGVNTLHGSEAGAGASGTTPPGQKPAAEVGGIPAQQSADPQVNITPVGTIQGNADPQIPALITPPGQPFPEPAVVVVKEGDSPFETVTPDGGIESAPAADATPEPEPVVADDEKTPKKGKSHK